MLKRIHSENAVVLTGNEAFFFLKKNIVKAVTIGRQKTTYGVFGPPPMSNVIKATRSSN